MYGHPSLPCMGGGCVQRLDVWRLVALLDLRKRPVFPRPVALFSLGGGYLDGREHDLLGRFSA